ncbi:DNA glycosylase [Limtongia smithiae]|uniref:DNA glycosylase n=1 Tax=Limtongia smithiae TaxID=1125753 RepID=UPI0034CEF50B
MTMAQTWKQLRVPFNELALDLILPGGQSFRWRKDGNEWVAPMLDTVVVLTQHSNKTFYRSLLPCPEIDAVIHDYFNADISLKALHREFSARDPHYDTIVSAAIDDTAPADTANVRGVRMLRQDPWETLCSFICSSNNSIKRITKMIDALCSTFGTHITTYNSVDYYTFPSPAALLEPPKTNSSPSAPSTVALLRDLGFGYRAEYVYKTAQKLHAWNVLDPRENTLASFRGRSFFEVREFLLQFQGVGPKVADCVALMAFDCHDSVPIDTHIWKIIQRHYTRSSRGPPQSTAKLKALATQAAKTKTLSRTTYDAIALSLRDLWGPYAGWAQAVIFIAELNRTS